MARDRAGCHRVQPLLSVVRGYQDRCPRQGAQRGETAISSQRHVSVLTFACASSRESSANWRTRCCRWMSCRCDTREQGRGGRTCVRVCFWSRGLLTSTTPVAHAAGRPQAAQQPRQRCQRVACAIAVHRRGKPAQAVVGPGQFARTHELRASELALGPRRAAYATRHRAWGRWCRCSGTWRELRQGCVFTLLGGRQRRRRGWRGHQHAAAGWSGVAKKAEAANNKKHAISTINSLRRLSFSYRLEARGCWCFACRLHACFFGVLSWTITKTSPKR